MSISSLGSSSAVAQTQYLGRQRHDSDQDDGTQGVSSGGESRFANAISQALASLGASSSASATSTASGTTATSGTTSSSASTGSTSGTESTQQALSAFAQSLFAALQAQNGTQSSSGTAGNTSSSTTSPSAVASASGSGGSHHHHHGGVSQLESGLQGLIQQLGATSSSGSSSSTGTSTGSGTSSSSNSAIDALQSSFSNLLAAEGQSGSGASLTTFLQNLSNNVHGATNTGNVVKTSA